jgi:hypothetical protein
MEAEKKLYKVSEFKIHPLNEGVREGDAELLKRRVEALAASILEFGWQVGSMITFVLLNGIPFSIGGGTRLKALQLIALSNGKVKYKGEEFLASEFTPPQIQSVASSEGEIAREINVLNALDVGASGFTPHPLHKRLILALKSLPRVNFVGQKKYSASQTYEACGIKASNGGEREFSSAFLTLCSFTGFDAITAKMVKTSGEVRQYLSKKEDTSTAEKGGLIAQIQRALVENKPEMVSTLKAEFIKSAQSNWDGIGKTPKPTLTKEEKIEQGVTVTLTQRAADAKSRVEAHILKGEDMTPSQRVVLDYWLNADSDTLTKEEQRIASLAKPVKNGKQAVAK